MFLIDLNRAGSAKDLWPAGIADLAGVMTAVGVAAVARQPAPPPAGTRRLSLLTGLMAAIGTLSVFLATHRGLLAVTAVIYSLYPAGAIILARVLGSHERRGLLPSRSCRCTRGGLPAAAEVRIT